MKDQSKTKQVLIQELASLRQRIAELEQCESKSRQAEETLQDSERKYRNLFENSAEGIYRVSPEGRFITANPAAARILGYDSPEELISTITDIGSQVYVYPEDRVKAIGSLRKNGFFKNFEVRNRQKNGSIVWVLASVHAVRDDRGNILYHEGTSLDITERKQAEEVLQREKDFAESLVQTAQAIVLVLDTTGRIVSFNQYMEAISGYQLMEVQGKDWFSIFLQERDRNSTRELFLKAINDIQTRGNVNPIVMKDGRERMIEWYDKTLKDEKGNVLGLLSIGQDITARKQATDALRLSEENFRRSLDDSPLGMRIATIEGETLYANRVILDFYGYDSIEELRTTPIKERYTPESFAEFQVRKEKRKRGDHAPSEYEIRIIGKNGKIRHLQVFRKEILWDGERQFQVIYQDITERKQAEKALKKSAQLLRDTGEMAKVGGWELDLSTNVVSWTEEVNKIHGTGPGYKPKLEEALNFYAPESRPALEATLKKTIETGVPYDLESLFIPSGSKDKIWIRSLGRAVYSGGKIVKLAGTFQNIDKYKRAEEELRKSEEQFRVAQELSPDGFTILRPIRDAQERVVDFTWVYENATIARLNGTDPKAVVGRRLLELFPGHSGSQFLRAYQLVAESGEHCVFEADYCGESITKPTWFRIAVVPMGGDIAILAQDITDRKRVEEALQESRDEIQWLFKSMINAFVIFESVFDDNGHFISYRFIYINDAYECITGVKNDEVKGKTVHEVWPETEPEWIKRYGEVAVTGVTQIFDLYHEPTKKFYHCNVYRPWDTKDRFCVIFEDITERKRMEEEKHHLEERSRKVVEDIFRFIPEGVLVFSRKMELLRQNQAFRELLSGYARRLGFAEDELENLIIDKVKAGLRDDNIKEIKITRKHETGKQT